MNAVTYAETQLKVHEIYAAAMKARDELSEILAELTDMRQDRRKVEHELEMLELDLADSERVKHPEMSATAMAGHLKLAFRKDARWTDLKAKLVELANKIDEEDTDRRLTEKDIEIFNARMNELGGYLLFLAAAKNAETTLGSKTS